MAIPTVYDPNKMMSVAKIAGSKSPTASPTPKPVIPMSAEVAARETANKQQTAQAWINNPNSGQGGLDAYTAKQNERYAGALSANDTGLANRLTADAQRVGYTLKTPEPSVNMPVSATNAYQPPDYAALAAARTSAALAQKRTIADQQKASADTAFQQQTLRTNDNRTLQDFSRTQTANPFGNMGRKSFQEGLIGRERTQQDADAAASLQTQKSNIDQMLADYQNATADEQVRIADELQRADRQYQLELANSTGNLTDLNTGQTQRTLQGQQFDWNKSPNNPNNQGQVLQNQGTAIQNQLAQYQLGNYPAEAKAKATLLEQQVKSGAMSNEAAAYNLQQLKDPNSAMNQAQKIDLQLKQLDLKNAPEEARLKLQQSQKQIADIGVVHRQPQTAAEAEYDQQQVIKIKAEIANLKSKGNSDKPPVIDPKDSVVAYNHYKDQIDNSSYSKEQKQAFAESVRGEMTAADYARLYNGIQ